MNRSKAPSQRAIRQTAEQPSDLTAPPKRTDQAAVQRTADRPLDVAIRGVGPTSVGSHSNGSCLGGQQRPCAAAEASPRPQKKKRSSKTSNAPRWKAITWTIDKVRSIEATLEPMERTDRLKYVQEKVSTDYDCSVIITPTDYCCSSRFGKKNFQAIGN